MKPPAAQPPSAGTPLVPSATTGTSPSPPPPIPLPPYLQPLPPTTQRLTYKQAIAQARAHSAAFTKLPIPTWLIPSTVLCTAIEKATGATPRIVSHEVLDGWLMVCMSDDRALDILLKTPTPFLGRRLHWTSDPIRHFRTLVLLTPSPYVTYAIIETALSHVGELLSCEPYNIRSEPPQPPGSLGRLFSATIVLFEGSPNLPKYLPTMAGRIRLWLVK